MTEVSAALGRFRGVLSRRPDYGWDAPRWAVWAAVGITAGAYLLVGWSAHGVVIDLDEIVMLGNSRVIAGQEPSWQLQGAGFMPGLALLMAPVWWFTEDPSVVYRVGIWITCALGLVAVLPLTRLARWAGARPRAASVIAAVVMLAPARLLVSNFLLAETALLLATATLLVQAERTARSLSVRDALMVGLLVGAVCLAHGRGVAIALAAGAWALMMLARRPLVGLVAGGTSVAAAAAAYCGYLAITSRILADDDRVSGVVDGADQPGIVDLGARLIGQLWYASFAWPAIVIAAAALVVVRARHDATSRLLVLAVVFSLAISALQLSPVEGRMPRLDTWFYGRYLDHLWAILAVMGLALLMRIRWPLLSASVVVASAGLGLLMLTVTVPRIPLDVRWTDIHVLGVAPWISAEAVVLGEPQPWLLLTIIAVIFTVLVTVLAWIRSAVVPILGGAWLALSVVYDATAIDSAYGDRRTNAGEPAFWGLPPTVDIGIDAALGQSGNRWIVRGAERGVSFLDLEGDEALPAAVVASITRDHPHDNGARVYAPSAGGGTVLWVYPGPLLDQLDRSDMLLPEGEVFTATR